MKKRTKKYQPKRCFQGGGLLALLRIEARAENASPLREDQLSDLGRNYWLSFTNLTQGSASFESWENCVGSLNMGLVLAEKVFDGQGEQEIVAALDGLFKAKLRGDKTGRYRLDGDGIQSVREALTIHDQQMKLAHRREIVDSIATVKQRVADGNVYQVQAQV
jgi:hypothetical protein